MQESNEIEILKYRIKFIEDVFSKKIIIYSIKIDAIIGRLEELHYPKLGVNNEKTYNYLLKFPLSLISHETIAEYENEIKNRELQIKELQIKELQIKNMSQKPEEMFIDL
jgi:hypothetical protein